MTCSVALYGADTWRLGKLAHKYLGSSEMWCWQRMEFSWADPVRNKRALQRLKEERNILKTIKRRKANWICCLLSRNCLLNHVI
jgi:hypothetical protein